jgi:4-hydroxybenzoate polyprenyltransferase
MALCAVAMVYQTYELLLKENPHPVYIAFVFFSTICSYNFHWMLTPATGDGSGHVLWSRQHKPLHFVLFLIGLAGAAWYFIKLEKFWLWLLFAVTLTFLYTAPKIPFTPFRWLKKVAIGKTIFLAMMWVYVTVSLPVLVEGVNWTKEIIVFTIAQFFFVFSICILFDYRDREHDKAEHIISLITHLSEQGITGLFYFSLILYFLLDLFLILNGMPGLIFLLIPAPVLAGIFNYAKKKYSDYLYYFFLDGLLMLPGLLLWLVNRF